MNYLTNKMREALIKIDVPKMKRKWNHKRGIQTPQETYSENYD